MMMMMRRMMLLQTISINAARGVHVKLSDLRLASSRAYSSSYFSKLVKMSPSENNSSSSSPSASQRDDSIGASAGEKNPEQLRRRSRRIHESANQEYEEFVNKQTIMRMNDAHKYDTDLSGDRSLLTPAPASSSTAYARSFLNRVQLERAKNRKKDDVSQLLGSSISSNSTLSSELSRLTPMSDRDHFAAATDQNPSPPAAAAAAAAVAANNSKSTKKKKENLNVPLYEKIVEIYNENEPNKTVKTETDTVSDDDEVGLGITDELTEEEILKEKIKHLKPASRPFAYNIAYYVNSSPVVRKFVEMGVSIRKWDEDPSICEFILKLNFEKDVLPYIMLFHDMGLPIETQVYVISKNPFIFREKLADLNVRVEYLRSKRFDADTIQQIVSKAPKWLSLPVEEIDKRLGWLQNLFQLNGNELRAVVANRPKLVTLPMKVISDALYCLKHFVCFDEHTIRKLIVAYPRLFTKSFEIIESNFVFLTQVMKINAEHIVNYPPILQAPLLTIKLRYAFLKSLERIQFDPAKANYISLKMLIEPDEAVFCKKIAKCQREDYKKFLKTI